MRWFKHLTSTRNDPDMKLVFAEFGFEGYGVFFFILETIAENLDHTNIPEATMSVQQWCNSGAISPKKLQNILVFLSKYFCFSVKKDKKMITIKYPKLLKYRDEYTRKQRKVSGH